MSNEKRPSSIENASARLRAMSLAADEGAPLGAEDALQARLGIARSTVRQAARILEREGLLRVKRGASGGYFAARPQMEVIENAVSAYLRTKSIVAGDVMAVGDLLWPEAVRRAAVRPHTSADFEDLARAQALVDSVHGAMTRDDFIAVEKSVARLIVRLSGSSYIELIVGINSAFFRLEERVGLIPSPGAIAEWRERRVLELTAIRTADEELAVFAGRFREFLHAWVMKPAGDQQTR
jgi:GntR family transcriptional regulator, transcriptional repressor for pyruvate dehydrogenase complex